MRLAEDDEKSRHSRRSEPIGHDSVDFHPPASLAVVTGPIAPHSPSQNGHSYGHLRICSG